MSVIGQDEAAVEVMDFIFSSWLGQERAFVMGAAFGEGSD